MSEVTPGRALRDIQQAQAGLRKSRAGLRAVRGGGRDPEPALRQGWISLTAAHAVISGIPWSAANDEVMSRLAALQRYATSLLVRLRRVARGDIAAIDDHEDTDEDVD